MWWGSFHHVGVMPRDSSPPHTHTRVVVNDIHSLHSGKVVPIQYLAIKVASKFPVIRVFLE